MRVPSRRIEVLEHSASWTRRYEEEAKVLTGVFGDDLVSIHHVGSTAVPGLAAKPTIDILAVVRAGVDVRTFFSPMEALGYQSRGECLEAEIPGTPGRFYFPKTVDGQHTAHVHVCHEGHEQIRELLALRDYLKKNPDRARKYSALKRQLATSVEHDNVTYMRGKDAFLKTLIAEALTLSFGLEPQAICGLLFDLDGTLHSRDAAFWRWVEYEELAAGAHPGVDRAQLAALDQHGKGDKARMLEHLNRVLGWGASPEQQVDRFRSGIVRHVKLEEGILPLLESLSKRYRLGVVTNGATFTQRAKLEMLGILGFFDPVVISEEVGCRKPDAAIFELATRDWSLPPGQVLFVGDDPQADVEGARAFGLRALQITSPVDLLSVLAPLVFGENIDARLTSD